MQNKKIDNKYISNIILKKEGNKELIFASTTMGVYIYSEELELIL